MKEADRDQQEPISGLRECLDSVTSLAGKYTRRERIAGEHSDQIIELLRAKSSRISDRAQCRYQDRINQAVTKRNEAESEGRNRFEYFQSLSQETGTQCRTELGEWFAPVKAMADLPGEMEDLDSAQLQGLDVAVRTKISSLKDFSSVAIGMWLRDRGLSRLGLTLFRWSRPAEARALATAIVLFEQSMEHAAQSALETVDSAHRDYDLDAVEAHDKRDAVIRKTAAILSRGESSAEANRKREVQEISDAWRSNYLEIVTRMRAISDSVARRFPKWHDIPESIDTLTKDPFQAIPFGTIQANLASLVEEQGASYRTPRGSEKVTIPALLKFPEFSSLLLKGDASSKPQAISFLQAFMMRLLTSLPPGKVRFTIIDPIGLGRDFAQFMHLADYDEALVTKSIWTETREIENQLEAITEHMRMVIQKYLRGEYPSIAQYNEEAKEVAEPYRFLVVANFPAKFDQAAAERLLSIASSGKSCGVYVLMNVDSTQELPGGIRLEELERESSVLEWRDGNFFWQDEDYAEWPIAPPDQPPTPLMTNLLQMVGERAGNANRVEVPFHFVAPQEANLWECNSRTGISIHIGRAGARRRQKLELGRETAQHALVTGKTGSGKSSLLHAVITNLALHYSPQEVSLYLVDFKKGVEFKPYAVHGLPHARVIAIESEREFGLSVLLQVDSELQSRAEKFRSIGVQDFDAYRAAISPDLFPRIVLVVDEFQEFFVEDDKVQRDSALLLDRLVRQGRAFGIHIVLCSQTLGGAYSLARATIDQMAVRIALQSSDADARLVLGDDNAAARLLSRPGEAIYNDANGRSEGNTFFQVAWLSEEQREHFLARIRGQVDVADQTTLAQTPIVFEGNVPADIRKIPAVADPSPPERKTTQSGWTLWLGEPTAIKEHTNAVLRRQAGGNLLIVGNNEETASALTCAILLSIARQQRGRTSSGSRVIRVTLFDGTPVEESSDSLVSLCANNVPCPLTIVDRRESGIAIIKLANEVRHRMDSAFERSKDEILLLLHGVHFVRDLKRSDGWSTKGIGNANDNQSAVDSLATILRDGPAVSVHVIAWCDTFANLNRRIDRQSLLDFEMRVVMQMSAGDSMNLIDNPDAAKLGFNRAYLYSDERATLEKFRPYGAPNAMTIRSLCRSLSTVPVQ